MSLAGGIMQNGFQCGMIWGAALSAGSQIYHHHGPGPRAGAMAIIAAQKLVEAFRTRNKHINCLEITDLNKSASAKQMIKFFLIKGGVIGCFRMAARYAPVAFNEIKVVLTEKYDETSADPVSCAEVVARKMGASDMQAIMAAGLAGGIGLCGGACGALGAALWLTGINIIKAGADKINFENPKAVDLIDRFLKCTDFKFECAEIVGRKFANIEDHASYLKGGGCSEIIKTLAISQ